VIRVSVNSSGKKGARLSRGKSNFLARFDESELTRDKFGADGKFRRNELLLRDTVSFERSVLFAGSKRTFRRLKIPDTFGNVSAVAGQQFGSARSINYHRLAGTHSATSVYDIRVLT